MVKPRKSPAEDQRQIDWDRPTIFLEHIVIKSRPVDRASRKEALQTIFTELRATTFRQRRAVMRELHEPFTFYVEHVGLPRSTPTQVNQYLADMQECASKLAALMPMFRLYFEDREMKVNGELILDNPTDFTKFIGCLQMIEKETMIRLEVTRGAPKTSSAVSVATGMLVGRLASLYTAATGKKIGAGRGSESSVHRGKAIGPFFRLVKAAMTFTGHKQADNAILEEINHHRKRIARRTYKSLAEIEAKTAAKTADNTSA